MKRKLLFTAMLIASALGINAQTYTTSNLVSDGWTQVTSITDVDNKFYMFVEPAQTAALGQVATNGLPVYNTLSDPLSVPSLVWVLEGSGTAYKLKNAQTGNYFNSGNAGWNDSMNAKGTDFTFTLTDGKFDLSCTTGYVGWWNEGTSVGTLPESAAANKQKNDASAINYAQGFYVYSISRSDYIEQRAALLSSASKTNPVDITSYILNNDFSSNNANGWIQTGSAGNQQWGQGTMESWNNNNVSVSQTITGLPDGLYTVSADIIAGPGITQTAYVFGNNGAAEKTAMATANASASNYNTMSSEVTGKTVTTDYIIVSGGELTLGFKDPATGTGWVVVDNFKLTYYGFDLGELKTAYENALSAAQAINQETPMLGTVLAALQSALSAYATCEETKDALTEATDALNSAVTAANTSIGAYANAKTAIDAAKALKDAHNFASAAAITTFADAIAAIETPYNGGTLTDADANAAGTTLGTAISGWHGNANGAASNYMEDGFSLTDFGATLYVNTWSTEGGSDGSDFKVPFYEYWIADDNSLGANTWTATLSGLENGLYSVSAWVRVRAKNGTAATGATGITMDVNGGGEGDYAAVDVTEGTQVGESQFQIATYTAQNLVKDGTLTLNFNVAADNNISWLSFKNVKYTKVRDLTPEEAAIIPTAIALYNGETEVTSDIELDATTTSVTLTPSFTPADATQTVTWISSDESVATVAGGVVTAVSPGTATITVTSTLDASVSATATVTVDFPETATPASYYVNSDATRTVYTVGENLIKNGTFEYPDGFYGWTDATAGAAKLTSSNFEIVTDGENKYLKSKNHGGSTAASSIGTAWPIEAGKTYVFGYKAKAVNAGTTEYHVVSLTNTLATETSKISTTQTVGTDWTDIKYTFTNTDNYAYLQFRARWLGEKGQLSSFDDFYLAEVTPTTEGNVEYATAAIPTANIGTGAFQYSQDAIDAANALVQGTATVEDVTNAYNALTTLNEPAAGDVFNIMITTNDTYGFKNNPLTFNADNASGAYFGQNVGVKAHFAQQVVFTKVEGNKYTISTVNANNDAVYVGTNKTINNSGNTGQIRLTTDPSKALAIQIVPTSEGVYNLLNTENSNNKLGCQDNPSEKTTGGLYTCNVHNDFTITPATKPSVSMAIDASVKYGTRIFPFSAAKPEGITLYTCESINGTTLELTTADAIVANTPYIIYAEEGYTGANLEGFGAATDDTYTEGLLTGVYSSTVVPVGSYVLQKNNEKVAFYLVEDGEQPTANANRAYLNAPAAGVKAAAYYFGTATAIRSLFNGLQNGDVYDLAGRKVQKMQKGGVYIVNGQKVVVK